MSRSTKQLVEFLSYKDDVLVQWNTTQTTKQNVYHQMFLGKPSPMTEYNGMAQDGTLYFGMKKVGVWLHQYAIIKLKSSPS